MKKQSFFHFIKSQICQPFICQTQKLQIPQPEVHNAGVLKRNNINLTALKKELLLWHFQLCHQ